ncbi:MAG: ribosome recycling factor [Firmicutes bacterium]|jgi:ribosome recycling factor|nr:ribosome recycling factor [Bacillota bacterium]
MVKQVLREAEDKMKRAVEAFRRELAGLRAGRATPALLDRVLVDYYGNPTPVNQVGTVTVPEPRLLVIQPWDKSMIGAISKAIMKSDIGMTPVADSNVIRLVVPQLTKERRAELVKGVRKKAEEERVGIRNIRREAIQELKALEKAGEISEDDSRRGQDEVQKVHDRYMKEIDHVVEAKEKEIMEV